AVPPRSPPRPSPRRALSRRSRGRHRLSRAPLSRRARADGRTTGVPSWRAGNRSTGDRDAGHSRGGLVLVLSVFVLSRGVGFGTVKLTVPSPIFPIRFVAPRIWTA